MTHLELIEKVQVLACGNPQAIILKTSRIYPEAQKRLIVESFKDAIRNTNIKDVPVLVADGDWDIQVLDLTSPQSELSA